MQSDKSLEQTSVRVDDVAKDEWRCILKDFADASIYQTWEYGDVRWGAENMSRVVVQGRDGEVMSAAQCRIIRAPLLGAVVAYVPWGPMARTGEKGRYVANFKAGLRALVEEFVVSRSLLLRVRPFGFEETNPELKKALLDEGYSLTDGIHRQQRRTILLDLEPSADELRLRLRKRWRAALRAAETNSTLELLDGFDETQFPVFKRLFAAMIAQKKFNPGVDVNEFLQMQERLPPEFKMRIAICRARGEAVAGSVCSAIGDTSIGLLGATGQAGRQTNASYLLQWDEILWSKAAGKRFYDLGGINPTTNPGVYSFKAGLRGMEVTLLGVYDISRNRPLQFAVNGMEKALSWVRKGWRYRPMSVFAPVSRILATMRQFRLDRTS